MTKKRDRPSVTRSVTVRQPTSHGTMFVTITSVRRRPLEVFANIGKAGSCERAWVEAVTRLISTALRYRVPPQEIVDQLKAIKCDPPVGYQGDVASGGTKTISSPADGIAWILEDFLGTKAKSKEASNKEASHNEP